MSNTKTADSMNREEFPEINFRRDIAEELSRQELIDRLCEMHKSYTEMRKEWFELQPPSAEGAGIEEATIEEEKILLLFAKHTNCFGKSPIKLPCMTRSAFIEAIKEFAALNREKNLREERKFTDWCINHVEIESREEKYIIDNETTIYSFEDLKDYWDKYLKSRE